MGCREDDTKVPLLDDNAGAQNLDLKLRVWVESKKLWQILGSAIISRLASYATLVITQAFAGHLGDLDLAAISIANNVIVGLCFGFLLGMASALETLCGQAFGAKHYRMLGVYMQRSWIVLCGCCVLLLPLYIYTAPILKLLGQPSDVSEACGVVSIWFIPMHFSFAFLFPLQRFLQSQLKTAVIAWVSIAALVVHIVVNWLLVYRLKLGLIVTVLTLDLSWWVMVIGLLAYAVCGGCPLTWHGFSVEGFSGLWEFIKLSTASGFMLWSVTYLHHIFHFTSAVMSCIVSSLENWYYRILILMSGNLSNAEIAIDALSICMIINGWEIMIPFAFFAATGVRVANELGAGNGKGAKFATIVSVGTSTAIGVFLCVLIVSLHNKIGSIFSTSEPVLVAVNKLSVFLAVTILLNSVQPVLSGVAVGSGWQVYVAFINLGCYYLIGLPLGFLMGWVFRLGVQGIWAGMIFGGTAVQTMILVVITMRCDWDKEAEKATLRVKKWDNNT